MNRRILFAGLCALAAGCSKPTPEPASTATAAPAASAPTDGPDSAKGLPDRDPKLAKKLVDEGAVLLDVRSQEEWDAKHLDGATLIPVGELDGRLGEVDTLTGGDKDKPIVVYCKSGGRAARAKKALEAAGHTQVTNMGGIDDWPSE